MASRLYEMIARTPANREGGIDPLPLLHQRAERRGRPAKNAVSLIGIQQSVSHDALKFSYFIQEVLEDSTFIASNERLNEAAIADCIARLKKHLDEQEVRVKSAAPVRHGTLPPEQQRAAMNQYLAKMRALRGSPPGEKPAKPDRSAYSGKHRSVCDQRYLALSCGKIQDGGKSNDGCKIRDNRKQKTIAGR